VVEKPNPLTPAQMRERQEKSAEDQQWDETTGGMQRGIRSAYDTTTGAVRGTFSNIHSTWDRFTDGCTQLTSWFPGDNTRRHAEELNIQAGTEIKTGHVQLADKLLNRDLQFSISSFGLNDKLTVELSAELRKLHREHKDLPRLSILNEA